MSARGVARPMALRDHLVDDHDDAHAEQHDHDRTDMLATHHEHTLWVYWTVIVLGFWLILSPFSFGYLNESLWCQPSGGRGVWWSDQTHDALRAWLVVWSDVISGTLLVILGWRSLKPNRPVSLWLACGVGMWLVFAPVLFWAPTPASFYNDSIVGILIIALTILIPGMPNMITYMQHGDGTPRGWSYNPSSWPQRWILIATGFIGFVVSRHLTMYQLGYIDRMWDPFFGDSSMKVLDSSMSHAWPISDAGLGTISYTFEFLMGYMGSPKRWRTMPWMVTFFGVLVIPLGLVHILLVISQPVVVGHWCTLCLLAAGVMLPMIPLEVDEVIAMAQHVKQAYRRGDRDGSLWLIFWQGGKADGTTADERSPQMAALPDQPIRLVGSMFWGMSFPWTLVVSTILGVWLVFQPTVFGFDDGADEALISTSMFTFTHANLFHVAGALIVVCSVIAMGEVLRCARFLNVPLALPVAIIPWLTGDHFTSSVVGTIAALGVVLLSLPRGVVRETYGQWDALIK